MTGSQLRGADRWPINRENTALIVVDMQNIWIHPRGIAILPMSEDIVPRIEHLLRFCRSHKSRSSICTRPSAKIWSTSGSSPTSSRRPMMLTMNGATSKAVPGVEFYEPVKSAEGDLVVKKFRYSGFYGTQLENLLRALGRDTIAITGVATKSAAIARRATAPCGISKSCSCRIAMLLLLRRNKRRRSTISTSILRGHGFENAYGEDERPVWNYGELELFSETNSPRAIGILDYPVSEFFPLQQFPCIDLSAILEVSRG